MANEGAAPPSVPAKRHMLIAGTGRAGTSFLVKYLDALGLDTHLSHHGEPQWSALANAGLEDLPIADLSGTRPYVLKSPWIGNVLDQILDDRAIAVDVALIPVRDLKAAAASRIVTEIQNIYERSGWMTAVDSTWREWGITEGGAVFSLEPLDQERILAVQFARLVQKVVAADIPYVLLDFPRIVEDGAYLYEKIKTYLPTGATYELAMSAHRRVAEAALVRVERERVAPLHPSEPPAEDSNALVVEALTAAALGRAIASRKKSLQALAAQQLEEEENYRRLREQRWQEQASPPPEPEAEPQQKGFRRLLSKISALLALDREPVSLNGPRKRRSEANA